MYKTLPERLKEAMAGPPKVTGIALATACSVAPASVSDWLSGKSKTMEGANLVMACDFLKIRPKWLACGVGPMRIDVMQLSAGSLQEPGVVYLPDRGGDPITLELLEIFSRLDQTSKIQYLMLLRGFVEGRRPHQIGNASEMAG